MNEQTTAGWKCERCGTYWTGYHECPTIPPYPSQPSLTYPAQPPPLTEQRVRDIVREELRAAGLTSKWFR